MKYLTLQIFLLTSVFSFAQSSLDFHVASLSGKFVFQDFEAFADSYNSFYANDPDLLVPLKIKTFATGYQFGSTFNYGEWFNGSMDFGSVRTAVSRAEWGAGFDRGFQIRSFLFDMDAGFYVVPEDALIRISIGLGLTLQSTQIQSFIEYDKTRSYGSETLLNGVWSSWRGCTPLVLKLSHLSTNERWKFFVNTRFPIQKKKINSTGFTYSSGFTSGGAVFPADVNGSWSYENRLSEDFRFINVAIGIAYNFSFL